LKYIVSAKMKNANHLLTEGRRVRRPALPAKLKARAITLPPPQKTPGASTPTALHAAMPTSMAVVPSGTSFFRRLFSFGSTPKAMLTTETIRSSAHGKKGRVLWIGDAVVPTGFGTVTHSMLQHLCQDWDVVVSGVNYDGSPHSHPYTILPACQGGDMWGIDHFRELCARHKPDAVIINNDWWNVAAFLREAPASVPVIAYMPVDGANLNPAVIPQLNQLAAAVWYTHFGHREAVNAGFRGPRHIIPHGLDTRQFRPVDRSVARRLLELPVPENAFIVGNVNRNQPRKRLDLTLQYFAQWVQQHQVPDAYLLLHCAKQDVGWDLESVARYYGIGNRLLFTGGGHIRDSVDSSMLPLIYSALDVQVSTTLGEGWGLTTMEGMACGVPQIVPAWAALGEWATPALKVPCPITLVHPEINTVGAVADKDAFVSALQELYTDAGRRRQIARQSVRFARQNRFHWDVIAHQMENVLEQVIQSGARKSPTASRRRALALA
jgi:D-inositol-3-phosphate glycosyltransferase